MRGTVAKRWRVNTREITGLPRKPKRGDRLQQKKGAAQYKVIAARPNGKICLKLMPSAS